MSITKVKKRTQASSHLDLFTLLSYTVINIDLFDKNNKNKTLRVFRNITAAKEIEIVVTNFRLLHQIFTEHYFYTPEKIHSDYHFYNCLKRRFKRRNC